MNRLEKAFESKPFIAFFTLGIGGLEKSLETALALVEGGADILEIGFPFSDPIGDGPIIQKASQIALENKTTFKTLEAFLKAFRKKSDVPLVLFTYYNPLYQKGL